MEKLLCRQSAQYAAYQSLYKIFYRKFIKVDPSRYLLVFKVLIFFLILMEEKIKRCRFTWTCIFFQV